MSVDPMASNIDGHRKLEEEHVFWIEDAKCDQETHSSTSIGQLVQDRAEFRAWNTTDQSIRTENQ